MANTKLGGVGHDDMLGAVNRLLSSETPAMRAYQWALEMALGEPHLGLGSPDQRDTQHRGVTSGRAITVRGLKHTTC